MSGMNEGIKTVIYPVTELEQAKALFRALMGEPAYDSPVYVGYSIGGQNIGLDPNGRRHGLVRSAPAARAVYPPSRAVCGRGWTSLGEAGGGPPARGLPSTR
jgi:hypothetical protein